MKNGFGGGGEMSLLPTPPGSATATIAYGNRHMQKLKLVHFISRDRYFHKAKFCIEPLKALFIQNYY